MRPKWVASFFPDLCLVLGGAAIMLESKLASWSGKHSRSISSQRHNSLRSAEPAFFSCILTMQRRDMAPQRQRSLHCSVCHYWSSSGKLFYHRLIIRSFPTWLMQPMWGFFVRFFLQFVEAMKSVYVSHSDSEKRNYRIVSLLLYLAVHHVKYIRHSWLVRLPSSGLWVTLSLSWKEGDSHRRLSAQLHRWYCWLPQSVVLS